MKRIIGWWLVGIAWFGFMQLGNANERFPELRNNYVNDYAQVLTSEHKRALRDDFQRLEKRTGVEMTVATINTVADYAANKSLETYATALFNHWGIGNLPQNNGVLLLIAVDDRKMRIELGSGYPRAYDQVAQRIINHDMLPHFKKQQYSAGIYQGAQAVITQIAQSALEPASAAAVKQTANDLPILTYLRAWQENAQVWLQRVAPGVTWPMLGGGGVGIMVLIGLLRVYLRHRPRRCQACGGLMQRLEEQADNVHLDSGQLAEERLASVDYDVWKCPNCETTQTYAYKKWFSSYSSCPSCHHKTLQVKKTIVSQATQFSEGSRRINENCQHCSFKGERYETIPMETRSDSSSSSSGGGRSSGGGASGSW